MIIRAATVLFTALVLTACSLGGGSRSNMATTPEITSALHADYVITNTDGQRIVRFESNCDGADCLITLVFPASDGSGVISVPFSMNCEGSVCTFASGTPPQQVSQSIDLSNGFQARAAGDTAVETEFGTLTTEIRRGVTAAEIPGQIFPGLGSIPSAFSGWGDWGAFVISHVRTPLNEWHVPIANSAGHGTYENPVAGAATWTGIVGAHTYTGTHVEGNADLTVDFAGMDLDVGFTGMRDEAGQTYGDLNWRNLAIVNGGFADGAPGESIEGRFYGPNHEEAGGIFERGGMVGGFHTIRSRQ